ncbi:MAG: non-ribosomal peptide synthetase, partial [Rhodothermales bacterium]|nr:non-ribosomal peptide synthetase [Rhodothermales bacterium]
MPQVDIRFVPFDRREIEQSIPDRFAKQVRHSPQSVAVWSAERSLTYDALDRYANRIAVTILHHRIPRENPVAILLPQGVEHVAAVLGVLKAGKAYVPLDPISPAQELRAVLLDSGSGLIVSDESTAALARDLSNGQVPICDVDTLDQSVSDVPPVLSLGPDSLAYIYYTSGTTGPPKGVLDNHRNVLHNIMRYTNSLKIRRGDRLTLLQSPAFSGAVSSLFCAVLNGATCYPFDLRRLGFRALASLLEEQELTVLHCVPTVFQHLVETGVQFPSLRLIRLEGDQVHRRHVNAYRKHFGPQCVLVNGMGATETGLTRQFFIDLNTELADGPIPIGYQTDDMETILIDEFGIEVTPGQIGEIAVRSHYLALGYWNRPKLTRERFRRSNTADGKRTYRTGDLGRFRADGCLEYLGRQDHQTRIRGRRVDLQLIERTIRALPDVVDAVVVAESGGAGEPRLVGYVVPLSSPPTSSALRRALVDKLPTPMIPTAFVLLDEIPVDDNGKVRRRNLPPPSNTRPTQDTPFVSPRNVFERKLVAICGSLLGISSVGAEDDFFDLGFDSLSLLQMLSGVQRTFGQDLPSSIFLTTHTI